MAKSNGFKPGSLDWIQHQYEFHHAKAEMYKGVLDDAGVDLRERKQHTANAMFSGALKLDTERRDSHQQLPVEEWERRMQIVRVFLARMPLSGIRAITGELRHRGVETSDYQAVAVLRRLRPELEQVGERQHTKYRLRSLKPKKPGPAARAKMKAAAKPEPWNKGKKLAKTPAFARTTGDKNHPSRRKSANYDGTTAEKARIIAEIIQANGGVMGTKELTVAAKEKGISALTGMVNYLNAGWLRRTRLSNGNNAYRFMKMPPGPEPEQAATQ